MSKIEVGQCKDCEYGVKTRSANARYELECWADSEIVNSCLYSVELMDGNGEIVKKPRGKVSHSTLFVSEFFGCVMFKPRTTKSG